MPQSPKAVNASQKTTVTSSEAKKSYETPQIVQVKRPTTLELDSNRMGGINAPSTSYLKNDNKNESSSIQQSQQQHLKTLFRSNSSSIHKRPSTFVPAATTSANNKFKLSSELDQIFVISSNRSINTDDDNYDSIDVIDERRMKNMPKSDRARLYKSNTFICEEYYTNEQLACVIDVIDADTKEIIPEEKRE